MNAKNGKVIYYRIRHQEVRKKIALDAVHHIVWDLSESNSI